MKLDTTSLFKRRDSRPITYQEAHDELLSTFDTVAGIDSGENNVGLSDFENPLNNSLYQIWMETYVREGIGDYYRISFDEWLERPRWMMMNMLEVAKRRRLVTDKAKEKALPEDLEKELLRRV